MGKVIVVTSGKGGVGKTTSTAALGAALAQRNEKVVVVDFDVGLRNLDLVMGAERRVVYDLINVIQGDAKLSQALIRDKRLETLFLLPLNGAEAGRFPPDGKAAVWRTRDGGDTWEARREGLPQENAFFAVLRQAMATDGLEPAGVYFGTNSGSLFASADEGDSWSLIAQHLPTVLSVETLVVDG